MISNDKGQPQILPDYEGLYGMPTSEAIEKAKQQIHEERSGEQHGLYCRFEALNRAMLKYWRFEHTTMIAGMSGSGKSYFLNMLRQDFLDTVDITYKNRDAFDLSGPYSDVHYDPDTEKWNFDPPEYLIPNARYYWNSGLVDYDNCLIHKAINKGCKHKVLVIHFGFEMTPADELLRMAGNVLGKSYGYLMSAEKWDDKLKDYAKLTDMELKSCEEVLDTFKDRKEIYIPSSGNTHQIYATVEYYQNLYPDHKIFVTLDHTLLSKRLNERTDMELQASMGKLAIRLRTDFGAGVIYLNQLNQGIEHQDRITKASMHYPAKKDIHLGGQIWWAMDNVMINHRPAVLNIRAYGQDKLITDNLIHGVMLKSRKGKTGNIWYREDFTHGRIIEATKGDFLPKAA